MNTNKKLTDSLSKFLAQAGIASRRKVVDIIKSGVVTVNDIVVREPGSRVTSKDAVKVTGELVRSESKVYILLNKPKNCITTVSDDLGRHGVIDLITDQIQQRVYPVGRMDRNTTGLLILTNDGDLALKLLHPRYEVEKIYHLQLDKQFHRKDMRALLEGVELEDGLVEIERACFFKGKSKINCEVVLHSGKHRIVRRIFERLGYEVVKLDLMGYAGLTKAKIPVGSWRHLTQEEVAYLKQ